MKVKDTYNIKYNNKNRKKITKLEDGQTSSAHGSVGLILCK